MPMRDEGVYFLEDSESVRHIVFADCMSRCGCVGAQCTYQDYMGVKAYKSHFALLATTVLFNIVCCHKSFSHEQLVSERGQDRNKEKRKT